MAQRRKQASKQDRVVEGAVAAEAFTEPFPAIDLSITPPFPPMEARVAKEIPAGDNWLYEPKWDGFRCLVFRRGEEVLLQSKAGQPLGRYFPELVEAFRQLDEKQFVLDGEIVIFLDGQPSFEDLLLRIHPAASRIRKLSGDTPASFVGFDLLVDAKGRSLIDQPLSERRTELEEFAKHLKIRVVEPQHIPARRVSVLLSPATRDVQTARHWMTELTGAGFDGVVAKKADAAYASGERTAMVKIKRIRTADCVVGGFRYSSKGRDIGSLLLGLYNDDGKLDHVGFTSSFNREERKKLKAVIEPYMKGEGFTGRAPGGPSRWSTERSAQWEPLRPKLVCEVAYDHFSQGRFRHGTKFLRWRPDKSPRQCTFEQLSNRRAKAPQARLAG
jgi:ATP-dependent DNA ligase